jgi:signal transduction histidine kinase
MGNLRHDLANPLSALLGETQLILAGDAPLDDETRIAVQEIEKLALRMRDILKSARISDESAALSTKETP